MDAANFDVEIVDPGPHYEQPDPNVPESSLEPTLEREETVAEILAKPKEPVQLNVPWQGPAQDEIPWAGVDGDAPESEWAPPIVDEVPSDALTAGIAKLADDSPDPFMERYGFDAEQAQEIFAQLPEAMQPQTAEELIAALDAAQVTSVEDARRFRDHALTTWTREEKERARDEAMASIQQQLAETRSSMPGSPLDSRLSNIEAMLTEGKQREQEQEYVHQESARLVDSHSAALGQLVEIARARGIEPPDPAAVERFYQMSGAIRLEPHYAAKLAWTELVGGELFGPKPDPRRASITIPAGQERPTPRGYIPAGSTGSTPRTIHDLIQEG